MRLGVCLGNGGDLGLDWIADMRPAAVLVMEGQAGVIPELRRRFPLARVYLRLEAAGAAWDPLARGHTARTYAAYAVRTADRYRPDVLIPWNEANLEWTSVFPSAESEAGYRQVAAFAQEFIREYRATGGTVPVAFPAFSPGHQEDDHLAAARFFVDVVKLYDRLNIHTYWTREPGSHRSEWFGQRPHRQIAAYEWTGPVDITEFNREWSEADVGALAQEIEEWQHLLPAQVEYAMWFIASSPDPAFERLTVKRNQTIINTFARLNQEPAVPEPTYATVNIAIDSYDPFAPGQDARVTFRVTSPDGSVPGKGIATLQVDFPHGYDEWAYAGTTPFYWAEGNGGQPDTDGVFEFRGKVPAFDFQDGARAVFTIFYMAKRDNGDIATGRRNDLSVPLARSTGGAPVPPPAAPPAPVSSGYYADRHYLFKRLGDLDNKFAEANELIRELQAHLVGASDPK